MMLLYRLELGACALASNGALNQTIGVGLRSVNFGICAGVLQAVKPAEICRKFISVTIHRTKKY
jgi:hypothetical protein